MREIPEVDTVIRRYATALRQEAAALKTAYAKRTPLYNGILLRRGEEDVVYRFETEAELYLSDGTPVTVFSEGRAVEGSVLSSSGFDLTLSLAGEIAPLSAEMSSSPWYLLEDLAAALEKMIKSSYENELYATLIEKRTEGLKEGGKIVTGQEAAYHAAMERPITLLWGPPGTGKTYTLAEIAYAYYKKGISTLILSQSNVAVDCAILELSKRLKKSDEGKVLRFGSYRKKELAEAPIVLSSYDLALKNSPDLIKKREELEYRRQTATFSGAGEIEREMAQLRDSVHDREHALVYEAKVVGATLSRAVVSEAIFHRKYGAVLVDEASMCFVPQVLYAAGLATDRLVVVGDFRQLPPIVSDPGAKPVLGRDIFQFLNIPQGKRVLYHPWLVLLDTQRRMHAEIADFVSKEVYGGLLTTDPKTAEERETLAEIPPFSGRAMQMLDLTDTYNVCGKTADGSRFNLLSALVTAALAARAAQRGAGVAVVTPYVSQVRLYRALAYDLNLGKNLTVSSVHQFQGSETDAVFFDTVDFLRQNKAGYLLSKETAEDDVALRLLNVALTRARGKFVLVTNARYFGGKLPENAVLRNLITTLVTRERRVTPSETEELAATGLAPVSETAPVAPPDLFGEEPPFFAGERDVSKDPTFGLGDLEFYSEDLGYAASDVDAARRSVDLLLPNASYLKDAATALSAALLRAKARGVTVRVVTESAENTAAYFPFAEVSSAAIFPLLMVDGRVTHYNPLFCREWKNMSGWQSKEPLAARLVGRKTAETVQTLLLSAGKLAETDRKTPLFGLKQDSASESELTAKQVYTALCYLTGLSDDRGVDGYFSLTKTLKKKHPFRFVKTALGAECCFQKEDVWNNFFLADFVYSTRIKEEGIGDLEELLSLSASFYGEEKA